MHNGTDHQIRYPAVAAAVVADVVGGVEPVVVVVVVAAAAAAGKDRKPWSRTVGSRSY